MTDNIVLSVLISTPNFANTQAAMKANVYQCLHEYKEEWSIKSRETENYGKVVDHADAVLMDDVSFHVQDWGRRQALKNGQKNVHAMARGRVLYTADWIPKRIFPSRFQYMRVTYRPEWGEFRDAIRKRMIVEEAERVLFRPNGDCITIEPTITLP